MSLSYPVISADSHVNPSPFFWQHYLPERFKDRAPKLVTTEDGEFIEFEGVLAPFNLLGGIGGNKFQDYKAAGSFKELLRQTRDGGRDPEARLKDMFSDGVDAEVLYGGGPLSSVDPEFCVASFRGYNNWLADFCSAAPDRFIGLAYVPTWDVDLAIDEVKYAASRGLRGLVVSAFPTQTPEQAGGTAHNGQPNIIVTWPASKLSYWGPEYEPFWQTCVELNMPVTMHLGAALNPPGEAPDASFLSNLSVGKMYMGRPIADAIFSGLFQRFPEAQLVSAESGIGWAPFLLELMDRNWERHRYHQGSNLQEPPSFYFRRNIKATFIHDPVAIRERYAIGVENIMWSSDYPHTDTTWPNSIALIEQHVAGIPLDEQAKIVGGNAAGLYGINVKSLVPA